MGAFATIAAVVIVLVSLPSGWGVPGTGSTVVTAEDASDANSMLGVASRPQRATERAPAGNELADKINDVSSLEDSRPQGVRPLSEFLHLRRQRLRPLSEYLWDIPTKRVEVDRLGIEVEDTIDRFEGRDVFGVEILNVRQSSPAALAGLRSKKAAVSMVLKTITLVGTLVFVPTRFIYDWVSETGAGDWHDLIIGVDGERVQYVSQLENALGQVKEGDIVYLTLLRSGKRVQVPVSLKTLGSK
jgi:hypothetical protein